ncbi:MAG: hypothetical protein Q8918_13960 [Bacteroidota bacterium]|nr:hypothetical protein [Bacteroidota bacterium]MDP4251206.1 hypothetical protein [Bacteroidota bacterium]
MKKIILLLVLVTSVYVSHAQRFFFVESGNRAEKSIQADLLKASQFVTKSPLMSDYIIKTEVGFKAVPNITTLKIVVEDSVSFEPIYQANEDYVFEPKANSQWMLNMAMRTLIEKNINQIILCAKNDHNWGRGEAVHE